MLPIEVTPAAVICEGEMLRTATASDASSLNPYIPLTDMKLDKYSGKSINQKGMHTNGAMGICIVVPDFIISKYRCK